MIKIEARSPSPGQLKHRAALPEHARTIHPVSSSNFRIVAAEARSDATLAALLDAAYRENDSLREEIRQREEREKRISGLLRWHEQAVQKPGKEGRTPRPSSGLYAANPRNTSQDKDFYHVGHNPLLTLGRPPDQAYTLANRSNGKENHLKTNSYRSETRVAPYPKLPKISPLKSARLIGPGAPGSVREDVGQRSVQQRTQSKNSGILQGALPQQPASVPRSHSAEWGPGDPTRSEVANTLLDSRPRLIFLPGGEGASTVESVSTARTSESGTALFQAEIINCRKMLVPHRKEGKIRARERRAYGPIVESDKPYPLDYPLAVNVDLSALR